jgi:hypothetical protein
MRSKLAGVALALIVPGQHFVVSGALTALLYGHPVVLSDPAVF